ncbi:hypothetical protein G7L40_00365 [Paenibacillus polymyxa]|uniref:Uncharacterized protein n=1 Tax=Paenibacillus polymyxa TaxID=1406 RepID=A0A378XX30_PAEPO|nr:hypothetical protein [Paenibacillus polymyxa]MBE7897163.1 hypothetical protein [Paenibacillus polymyxa]MBG9763020.1 hypothetical protein [Paenibacillus polymyxa]MCC3257588.1 hypothetical protein [Paenibacillus polymyxa]QPK51329.1 hypothetical protein G7035_00365 [Paenibacillus polymyxa]QPK56419.1 hypothetical protein G7L40_00365 [Paenibacillus polymyxa]
MSNSNKEAIQYEIDRFINLSNYLGYALNDLGKALESVEENCQKFQDNLYARLENEHVIEKLSDMMSHRISEYNYSPKEIIEYLSDEWDYLTKEEQQKLGVLIAGRNNLDAFVEWMNIGVKSINRNFSSQSLYTSPDGDLFMKGSLFKSNSKAVEPKNAIVIVPNRNEKDKLFEMFKLLLNEQLNETTRTNECDELESDNFNIRIIVKPGNGNYLKGHRANYVLNLTQDVEFDSNVAKSMEFN